MMHMKIRAKALKSLLDELSDPSIKKHIASSQDMGKGTEIGLHAGLSEGHGLGMSDDDSDDLHSMHGMDGSADDEGDDHPKGSVVSRFKSMMKK